ncbi:cytochrome c [Pseudoduganella namucuonensis]|nr:cytochrome c [Pseudoduganella namucuonensis]
MKRTYLAGGAVLGLSAAAAMLLAGCGGGGGSGATAPAAGNKEMVERGRYLARAADCAACHTTPSGATYAGGVELASPYGKFYGTNITPHKEHGIGKWSADEFHKALRDGVTPDKHLYPAMPYTSYRSLTRADSDALYAYFMQLKPAAVKNREPDLKFPYNMRFGMMFWNGIFLEDELTDASRGSSAEWKRGRYLVNTLGHCAECHTPRGALGQMDLSRTLTGNRMARIGATDITPAGLAAAGWTADDLGAFLRTGVAPQGSATGEMFEVVHLSSQHLARADVKAMTTYLMGDKPLPPAALKPVALAGADIDAGRRTYIAVCAGCHGAEGQGKPHVAVPLKGNSSVRNADPHNLVAVTLDGIKAQHFGEKESMQEMPGFAKLSDKEVADLSNYMRGGWGGVSAKVTEAQVQAIRAEGGSHH